MSKRIASITAALVLVLTLAEATCGAVFAASVPEGYVSPAGLYTEYNNDNTTWIPSLYRCDALCLSVVSAESDMLKIEAHHTTANPVKEISIDGGDSMIWNNNFFDKSIDNGTVRIRGTSFENVEAEESEAGSGDGWVISFASDPFKNDYYFELNLSDIRFSSSMIEMHVRGKEYLSSTVYSKDYRGNPNEQNSKFEYDIDEDYSAQIMPEILREKPGEDTEVYFDLKFDNKEIPGQYLYVRVKVLGMLPKGEKAEVTEKAEATPGETQGSPIPAIIAVGVVAAGVAAVAGAAAAGKSGGDQSRQAPTFAMKIFKEFGDVIRPGDTVTVYARIVEIVGGAENDRPDLTERITAFGEGMTVQGTGMHNSYFGAKVTIPKDYPQATANLVFCFTGVGGVFKDTVIFRVLGEPRIVFPADMGDGRWNLSEDNSTVQLIAGLGGRDKLRFVIVDADEEPTDISFSQSKGLAIGHEPDGKLSFTYFAIIDNNTDLIEKGGGIFADKENREITVEAVFRDGRRISSYFTVELYPDGLSVLPNKDSVKDNHLIVDTLENPDAKEGYAKIPPAIFDYMVCFLDEQGKTVALLNEPSFSHEDPTDKGRYGLLFSDNFEYRLKHMGSSGVWLYPQNTLPELGVPYEASMKIMCDTKDQHFEGELPLAVSGERPSRPSSAEWQKAYAWLQRDVKYFGIPNDPQLRLLIRQASEHSASELQHARVYIITAGVVFYERYGDAYRNFDKLMTQYIVIAGSMVKAGDLALEGILKAKFGGYGKLAAKFINPLKNLLATYLGEYLANGNLDKAPDFIETVLKGCEDALSAAITGVFFKDDDLADPTSYVKKLGNKTLSVTGTASEEIQSVLGYVIAAYLLTCFVKHYNYGKDGEKGDIYRSVIAAVADLGYESLKAWLLNFITKCSGALFEQIGKAAGKLYSKFCQQKINEAAASAGREAFGSSIRNSMKFDLRGLTKESLEEARRLGRIAEDEYKELQKQIMEGGIKKLGEVGKSFGEGLTDNFTVGQFLNYLMGGSAEDEANSLGDDTKEVLFNKLAELLGTKFEKVYEAGGAMNPSEVTVRVENGRIILGLMGYYAEINILENIAAIGDMIYESLFSWMNLLWETLKSSYNYDRQQDLRDRINKNVDAFGKELEEQKRRIESIDWQFTEYRKKIKSGMETII